MVGEDPLTCAEAGPGEPLGWVWVRTAAEGTAAASEELGTGRVWDSGFASGAGARFEARGVSALQSCCGGVVGGLSVGAAQWLVDSVCDCVVLLSETDGCSAIVLGLPGASWTSLLSQKCLSWVGEPSLSLPMMSVVRISYCSLPGLGL